MVTEYELPIFTSTDLHRARIEGRMEGVLATMVLAIVITSLVVVAPLLARPKGKPHLPQDDDEPRLLKREWAPPP